MSTEPDDNKPFDFFELATAVLLGMAAVAAAVAGQQAGQWGGRQLDAFSEANTLTTKASTQYNEDTVLMNADWAAVAIAKQHILEARDARDAQDAERHLDLASYFYTYQLTENAYKAMGLPTGYYDEDEEATPDAPGDAAPEGDAAAGDEEEYEEEIAPEEALMRDIPDEDLYASLTVELDEEYVNEMLEAGEEMFAQADARFAEGRQANENGDKFDLAGVFLTVALFFAGLGLIFKTKMRWALFGMGSVTFVCTVIYMMTLPWVT
jgi:hypothetical protein